MPPPFVITTRLPLLTQRKKISYLRTQGWNQDEEKPCCLKFCRTSKKMRNSGSAQNTIFPEEKEVTFRRNCLRPPQSVHTPAACLWAGPRFQAQLHCCSFTSASAGQMLTSQPPNRTNHVLLYVSTGRSKLTLSCSHNIKF